MNLRVVLDTNILFSAVGWGGKPGRCLEHAHQGNLVAITSPEILEELAAKLASRLGFEDERIETVLGSLVALCELRTISGTLSGTQPDPKDDKILECALTANATHVVTGDRTHLLPLGAFRGIRIVTPAEMCDLLETS